MFQPEFGITTRKALVLGAFEAGNRQEIVHSVAEKNTFLVMKFKMWGTRAVEESLWVAHHLDHFMGSGEEIMQRDEQSIRGLVDLWLIAGRDGDPDTVLAYVGRCHFMVPGKEPLVERLPPTREQ